MFTGIVREVGRLATDPAPTAGGGARLRLAHSAALAERLEVGASLSVSGVCLTVVALAESGSEYELAPETLARTTLGRLRAGSAVNLEPALAAGEALGGHWVQGHVDGVLRVLARRDLGESRELDVELPARWRALVVEKGSVALDGVSLTVAGVGAGSFHVALIPHTLAVTTFGSLVVGDEVNFEADVLGKYVLNAFELYGGQGPASR